MTAVVVGDDMVLVVNSLWQACADDHNVCVHLLLAKSPLEAFVVGFLRLQCYINERFSWLVEVPCAS